MIEQPKYILLEIKENLPSKCKCGRFLFRFSAKLKESETGEEFILGSECFKKYLGKSYSEVRNENNLYNLALEQEDENIRQKKIREENIKKFIESSKEVIDYIEKRLSQEQTIFNELMKKYIDENSIKGKIPYYKGEFWQSLLDQIRDKGSLSEKQLEHVKTDMSRNRDAKFELKQKINFEGKVLKSYVTAFRSIILQLRSSDNVDISIVIGDRLREILGIRVKEDYRTYKLYAEGLPDYVKGVGTITYIDPSGGKIKLTRCKIEIPK